MNYNDQEIDPLAALADPNCETELWWGLATLFMPDARESVLYPLFLLEEPERWLNIAQNWSYRLWGWMQDAICTLSKTDQRLFAAACAERALPIWEKAFPKDLRPRLAIYAARSYALGKATAVQMRAAHNVAAAVSMGIEDSPVKVQCAAWAAIHASGVNRREANNEPDAVVAVDRANMACASREEEMLWQAHELLKYLAA